MNAAFLQLIRKDVRAMTPVGLVFVTIALVWIVQYFALAPPMDASWAAVSVLSSGSFLSLVHVLIGLMAAYLLLPREFDDGTLQFLWGLPVDRWQVLLAKVVAAVVVVGLGSLALALFAYGLTGFARNSIGAEVFSWSTWWLHLTITAGSSLVGLGYGVLACFFRRFGVVVFSLAVFVPYVFGGLFPSLGEYEIASLGLVRYEGFDPTLNAAAWRLHGGFAFASAVVGGFLWMKRADRYQAWYERVAQSSGTRVAGFATGLVLAIAALAVVPMLPLVSSNATINDLTTRYFAMRYFEQDHAAVVALVDVADRDFEETLDLLGTEHDSIVVADLTDAAEGHLGIAGWNKIRMDRSSLRDPMLARHVLVHEATHVVATSTADRCMSERGSATTFFNEGLAEWVSYELLGIPETREALRDLAAVAWDRWELEFADLSNSLAFNARFDGDSVYALGEAWVAALARACGRDAPGKAVVGLATAATRSGGSRALWEDALAQIGCDLGAVNYDFEQWVDERLLRADAIVPRIEGFIESMDRLVFRITRVGGLPRPMQIIVRTRQNLQAPPTTWSRGVGRANDGETIRIEFGATPARDFQYQFGVVFADGERPFYERWRNASP